MAIKINNANYDEVMGMGLPVVIDFWATWCGPCRMVSPILDEIASEKTNVVVGKINVDEEPELAQQFGVVSIPTLVLMKAGQVADTPVGYRPKEAVLAFINK